MSVVFIDERKKMKMKERNADGFENLSRLYIGCILWCFVFRMCISDVICFTNSPAKHIIIYSADLVELISV